MVSSRVTLAEGMHFIGELDGFKIDIDADEEFGGKNKGPKPKGLILTSLSGCTALDVISILRKMKNEPNVFYVESSAQLSEEHPKVFKNIIITYYFKGGNVSEANAKKAIELSLDKYCGVANTLKPAVSIEYKIIIE
jgi:putative redox protein